MTYRQRVIEFGPASKKPNSWLKVVVSGDDGKNHTMMVKDQVVAAKINKVGLYDFSKEKNSEGYQDVLDAVFVGSNGTEPEQVKVAGPVQVQQTATPREVDANTRFQNMAITAQVAIKSAAELIGKAIDKDAFKTEKGFHFEYMDDVAAILAGSFMKEAGKFLYPKPEPKPDVEEEAPF